MSEINITLFHPVTSKTDAISIPPSTTLADLSNFAMALLGLDGDGGVVLAKGQSCTPLYKPNTTTGEGNVTLSQCNISDGEFISVYKVVEFERMTSSSAARRGNNGGNAGASPARQRQRTNNSSAGAAGGLDFSALLGGGAPAARAPPSSSSGGMDFTALLSRGAAATAPSAASSSTTAQGGGGEPVQWDGMTLHDALEKNPNPTHLMTLLSNTTRHPNLMKQLNFNNPTLVKKLQAHNGDITKMAETWRQHQLKNATSGFLRAHSAQTKELEMEQRLRINPMDAEANAYFGEQIRLSNVQRQYEQMMEEYPESMGRVLMLYIDCTVNNKPMQFFVDSGAEMTVMSSACADRLGLLHLVDKRFAGVAVGVGTGKILGRIHIAELNIGGHIFPCTFTVMDSESGLGDKNMDVLFGLNMLKRHRCQIDLAKNVLRFAIGSTGETMEAPFLHEKDLATEKGGTKGFDAEKENAELEARLSKMEAEDEEKEKAGGNSGGEDEKKEEGGDDEKKDDKMDEDNN